VTDLQLSLLCKCPINIMYSAIHVEKVASSITASQCLIAWSIELPHEKYTQGESDIISSYHISACEASSAKCLLLWHRHRSKTYDRDNTDIFLNQLIHFYSNNATNLRRLTYTVRRVAPQHIHRVVAADYCDVTSPYVHMQMKLELKATPGQCNISRICRNSVA